MKKDCILIFIIFVILLIVSNNYTVSNYELKHYNTNYTIFKPQNLIKIYDGLNCIATIIGKENKDGTFNTDPYKKNSKTIYTRFEYPLYLLYNTKLETDSIPHTQNDPILKGLNVKFGINLCRCKKVSTPHQSSQYSTFYAKFQNNKLYKQLSGNCDNMNSKKTFHFENHQILHGYKGRDSVTLLKNTQKTIGIYNKYLKKIKNYKINYRIDLYCRRNPEKKIFGEPEKLTYYYHQIMGSNIYYTFKIYSKAGCPCVNQFVGDPFEKIKPPIPKPPTPKPPTPTPPTPKPPTPKPYEPETYTIIMPLIIPFSILFVGIILIIIFVILLKKLKNKIRKNRIKRNQQQQQQIPQYPIQGNQYQPQQIPQFQPQQVIQVPQPQQVQIQQVPKTQYYIQQVPIQQYQLYRPYYIQKIPLQKGKQFIVQNQQQ